LAKPALLVSTDCLHVHLVCLCRRAPAPGEKRKQGAAERLNNLREHHALNVDA